MGNSVLITGASGFVGTALAAKLRHEGMPVVSMVRDRTRTPPGIVVYGDVTDHEFCRRVLADYEIVTVYHLAAQSIVSACAEDPLTALHVAVNGTARLLQAVRDAGRPIRVVVMTSDKVYGDACPPYTEETPLDARNAYEVSKACQDLVARMFCYNFGCDVRVVRAVNIYGPGDPNASRIIPQTISRCQRGEPPLLHKGASAMRRQYVYIDDMIEALRVIRALPPGTYCVGSPDPPLSVREVMREIVRQMGVEWCEPEIKDREARFREIDSQSIDDRKIRMLGWRPVVHFAEGIHRTIEWAKSPEGRDGGVR